VEVYVPAAEAAVPEADRGEIIATRRLTLRRFRPSDAPEFHAVLSDAEAMRYWSTPPHRHMAETEAWVERTIAAVAAGEADDFIALHEGSAVGKAGLDLFPGFVAACGWRAFERNRAAGTGLPQAQQLPFAPHRAGRRVKDDVDFQHSPFDDRESQARQPAFQAGGTFDPQFDFGFETGRVASHATASLARRGAGRVEGGRADFPHPAFRLASS